jgi:hypothetical protein
MCVRAICRQEIGKVDFIGGTKLPDSERVISTVAGDCGQSLAALANWIETPQV